jgi:hypothetical protein
MDRTCALLDASSRWDDRTDWWCSRAASTLAFAVELDATAT